ncbi:MAG: 3'-5' exonuclease [Bacteroidota bacterium]
MYLFFDTETTGLPKNWKAPVTDTNNWPRLVQLAWLVYNEKGELIDAQDFIIKPDGFTIPAEASRVHGINTQRALEEGVELTEVLVKFNEHISNMPYLVAHNMSFDEKIVGAEFVRTQINSDLFF